MGPSHSSASFCRRFDARSVGIWWHLGQIRPGGPWPECAGRRLSFDRQDPAGGRTAIQLECQGSAGTVLQVEVMARTTSLSQPPPAVGSSQHQQSRVDRTDSVAVDHHPFITPLTVWRSGDPAGIRVGCTRSETLSATHYQVPLYHTIAEGRSAWLTFDRHSQFEMPSV